MDAKPTIITKMQNEFGGKHGWIKTFNHLREFVTETLEDKLIKYVLTGHCEGFGLWKRESLTSSQKCWNMTGPECIIECRRGTLRLFYQCCTSCEKTTDRTDRRSNWKRRMSLWAVVVDAVVAGDVWSAQQLWLDDVCAHKYRPWLEREGSLCKVIYLKNNKKTACGVKRWKGFFFFYKFTSLLRGGAAFY